ncbi:SusD/RagB family nutrient-binding outer membrane lipoprotein [Chitinophaga pendula]|uniref:SusD/RagB family nutrient-binding outer membrane lipoprotein n=1 Tax=Chitinophaga TaxID=79328 RepID=UPI000BAEEE7B|nr:MULTISPECIES: SusD/RagB family nutrient-binding outer membrane lipoprotein [Chitinophaga]ASZ14866.1 SusD/RagB family nutrient-binding outer membrane lipoprotein [Chitinophaga sp. MD30]UCJ05974.1 SusD/RagB family nutrient-binding outer membrane lipoprotein [Chitinophaga pendula]
MKRVNTRYILPALLIAVTLLAACQKQLEDINKNPNQSENVQPDYLLSNAIKSAVDIYWGENATMETSLLYVQYWAKIQYTDPDKYQPAATTSQSIWNNFYAQPVQDFTTLIQLGDTLHNPNYRAVGVIMRSWIFQNLTDLYGDVPYSQAANIKEFLTPRYDAQKDIYTGLLAELKGAVAAIQETANPIQGDPVFKGDMKRWKQFANSLRLRIAIRISDRDEATAKAVFDEVSNNAATVLSSNADNVKLDYLASPNQNPVGRNRETRNDYRISKSVVDKLLALNDPRLSIYAAKPKDGGPILGVTNGLPTDSASALGFNKTSDVGAVFTATTAPAILFNYAELLFIKAEAAARGLISADAEQLYKDAIRASLAQYNIVDATVVNNYLAQPALAYDVTNFRRAIGEQKWLALFSEGIEGFTEWRRLDYPQLKPAYQGVLQGKMPLRLTYPSSEQALNGINYKKAVANQGPDALITRLWFDVR